MSPVPAPRLCTLSKREDFEGYGFNLYKKKSTPGQFIGSIDPGSPAGDAGLKEGDKLIEVNGIDVTQENHKQVVQRIREIPTEVTLLVVDNTCEEYHQEKKIRITNLLPYVLRVSSKKEQRNADSADEQLAKQLQTISIIGKTPSDPSKEREEDDEFDEKFERSNSSSSSSSIAKSEKSLSTNSIRSTPSPTNIDIDGLNLPMTAKEMRERIEKTKRKDPRKEEHGDWWKKHMIVQAL